MNASTRPPHPASSAPHERPHPQRHRRFTYRLFVYLTLSLAFFLLLLTPGYSRYSLIRPRPTAASHRGRDIESQSQSTAHARSQSDTESNQTGPTFLNEAKLGLQAISNLLRLNRKEEGVGSAEAPVREDELFPGEPMGGGGLTTWGESSVYVERTNSLHPSRPSSFGPHLTDGPLRLPLYPITCYLPASPSHLATLSAQPIQACPLSPLPPPPTNASEGWIALTLRGGCPFSEKVRYAASLGAKAVLFGDLPVEEGGIGSIGGGGLLTPWSPDDTTDITIPSAFVSRATYLDLLQTWTEAQTSSSSTRPRTRNTCATGLMIIMSQDDLFAWPLLDALLLLLFLPSLLTLLTLFLQRIRTLHQQKLDRAPRDAVRRLPVFLWEEKAADEETAVGGSTGTGGAASERTPLLGSSAGAVEVSEREGDGVVRDEDGRVIVPSTLLSGAEMEARRSYVSRTIRAWLRARLARNPQEEMNGDGEAEREGEGTGGRRRTLGGKGIDLAPRRKLRFESVVECAICLCDFVKGDKVMELPCGHLFHASEIEPWLLESKRLCPVCRASITLDDEPPVKPVPMPLPVAVMGAGVGALDLEGQDGGRQEDGRQPVASSSLVTVEGERSVA